MSLSLLMFIPSFVRDFKGNPTAQPTAYSDCDNTYAVSESIDIYVGNIVDTMLLYENLEISFYLQILQNWTCPKLSHI